jgi:hypothetical protein
MHEIGRINGGRGFQTGGNVFQIGGNRFNNRKNEIPMKILELERSQIRIIAEICRIPTGFPNQDVTPMMGVTIDLIFKPLEWEKGGLRCARGGKIATTKIEVYAAALIVSATTTVACVESATTAPVWQHNHP